MQILLGSQSPRRKALLQQMDVQFESVSINCDERFDGIEANEVASFLAKKKSQAFNKLKDNQLLITADTTVILNERVLNKPENEVEASAMLRSLSNGKHLVNTGVYLRTNRKEVELSDFSAVWINELSEEEISYYVSKYKPYDKAGSYGIQEWLGICKISRIEGCYYNIMGLPTPKLYAILKTEFGL